MTTMLFRIAGVLLIVFSLSMAAYDFIKAVQYVDQGAGWVAYFVFFGLVMLALAAWNTRTLLADIRSEREHKDWLEKFETR